MRQSKGTLQPDGQWRCPVGVPTRGGGQVPLCPGRRTHSFLPRGWHAGLTEPSGSGKIPPWTDVEVPANIYKGFKTRRKKKKIREPRNSLTGNAYDRTVRVSVRYRGRHRPPAAQLRPVQETDPQALGHADPPRTGGRSILVKTQSLAPERHRPGPAAAKGW